MKSVEKFEASVIALWQHGFVGREVDRNSNFFELGGDSIAAINFLAGMERETGFVIPLGTLYRSPVLSDFVHQISHYKQEEKWPVVTPLQVHGLKRPLFVIAPCIGGVFHYREFAGHFPKDQPCYCLEPRISAAGQHSYESVEEIARWNIRALKDFQVEGPYRLCGYSFGGSIAWEMAKQLKASGDVVELLLVFDTIARGKEFFHTRHQGSFVQRLKQKLERFRTYRESYNRNGAKLRLGNVWSLVFIKFGYLFQKLIKRSSGGDEAGQEYAEEIEELVQMPLRSVYDYGTYEGEMILLRAKRQLVLRRELDYELGWTGKVLGGLRIIDVSGDHLTLMYGEPGREIAQQTIRLLEQLPDPVSDVPNAEDSLESLPFPEETITSPLDRFSEVVRNYGDRNAVLDNGRFYSFKELDALSDSICEWILSREGERNPGIAVYLENGYAMCAVFLGVLKSGRFYVPLDPEHPEERTSAIIEESGVDLMIASDDLMELAREVSFACSAECVSMSAVPNCPSNSVSVEPTDPNSPAAILFTSGSTGKPKGVLHNHRSVAYVGWRRGIGIGLEPSDRYLSVYSGAFMGFLNGFYASIQFGSCFCFYRLRQRGLENLAAWLNTNQISIFHSVTSVYRNFVAGSEGTILTSIRSVTPGGEPSRHSDIDEFKEHFHPGTVYYANLGSSETGSIAFDPIYHDSDVPKQIPVGKPFDELNLSIRNESGEVCPPNVEGEICLNTDHIFSGYWRDQEKTDEVLSILPDGSSLYRSGDYGLLLEDGRLVNLGRKDNQIKINGYRMELPDVESSFMKLPEVSEIAVIAREDETANDMLRLYAFYRLGEAFKDTSGQHIRESLLEHLPTPMIPNYMVELDSLPKNPTGKVDRKELVRLSRTSSID
jgi:amino acid adenylation domain-containing protein